MNRLIALVPFVLVALAGAACDDDPNDCVLSADCGAGLVCSAGQCVGCATNDDCAAAEFCCQGTCLAETEINEHCGCSAAPQGAGGAPCAIDEGDVCLVGSSAAARDTVDEASCGCSCTPALGGPICNAPDVPGAAPICSCEDNGDCRGASADGAGRPHLATDTCSPDDACVCFAADNVTSCDPDGATPDCSSRGCTSLSTDPQNCGVALRSCTEAATGIALVGTCLDGGCTCDGLSDCQGARLNVNTCAFVDDENSRCVCSGYTDDGVQAACPMELECGVGGCILDDVAYPTEASLREALGLAAAAAP